MTSDWKSPRVKALVRWATGKRLTNRLHKLSLITLIILLILSLLSHNYGLLFLICQVYNHTLDNIGSRSTGNR